VTQRDQTGVPKWSQNGEKHDQKSINFLMSFLMVFLVDFGPVLMPKWSQVGTKVEAETHLNTKTLQSLKCFKTNDISMILGVGAAGLRAEIHQKSMKKRRPCRNAFQHQFFIDFFTFLASCWEPKSKKKRWKKRVEK
jgi:hypothetical protein